MSALEKTNTEGKEVEDIGHDEKVLQAGPIIRPASLAALSEQEYDKLGKSATFKMDLVIMPCLVIMYIMNFLDRQNIAAAKLADIDVDLGLSDVEYQTCVSILFVGYSKLASCSVLISLICGSFDAGSFKHHCWQSQISCCLHLSSNGCLGYHLCLYGRNA